MAVKPTMVDHEGFENTNETDQQRLRELCAEMTAPDICAVIRELRNADPEFADELHFYLS